MFMGQYNHTIDAKGRLIIPSKFREKLGDSFIISRGFDGCLYAMDQEAFDEQYQKIKALPHSLKETREMERFFLVGAMEAEYDKQGRVLIQANLRSHAGLEKDVVLVGAGDKVEIWSLERWEKAEPDNIEEAAEKLANMGFDI
ncbi:MAG: division/cell wall cluster transcriptional repressor MraZ [Lachnospiraceae bacterium]|nr:division/cell wall cluster transcriptional repressor MraZ [Lachnospiraceae bacterium]